MIIAFGLLFSLLVACGNSQQTVQDFIATGIGLRPALQKKVTPPPPVRQDKSVNASKIDETSQKGLTAIGRGRQKASPNGDFIPPLPDYSQTLVDKAVLLKLFYQMRLRTPKIP
uniref:Uncharacterized protein n=1 Tax=Trichuris muris TaxID=70415 RepID=A0A5S6QND6_TRIMR